MIFPMEEDYRFPFFLGMQLHRVVISLRESKAGGTPFR